MNSTKFQRIKEEIMMADQICLDISIYSILKKADYVQKNMTVDEVRKFYNRLGEQLSLACEHYLKAMIIPRMHFDGIDKDSEEELNKIFDNHDKQGIAKKYSHYFDNLLTSDYTSLNISKGLIESILIRLAERLGIKEFDLYNEKLIRYKFYNIDEGLDDARTDLLNVMKNRVKNNRGAYPESRYGMFTEQRADLVFLLNLCLTLREYPSLTINNCLFNKGLQRHIFPTDESNIYDTRSDGTKITYRYSTHNRTEIIECNGTWQKDLTDHEQLNDIYPNITQLHDTVEIRYIEKGKTDTPVIIKYDPFLKNFCKSIDNSLQKGTNNRELKESNENIQSSYSEENPSTNQTYENIDSDTQEL